MVRGTAAGAPPRPRTASNAAAESSTASTSPAWTACSAARAPAWSTRPIAASRRARPSRVSTRWMMGVIMAPSQRKPNAPAHPLVPQRIAPGAPATRCANLLHKYAFRLVRHVTSPETTLSDIPSSNRETTVQAAHAPRFAAPCRRHARRSGARPLPAPAADQRRRYARLAATRHRRARRRSSVARGAAHHRVSRMAAQRGRTARHEDFPVDAVWDVATRVDSLGWTAEFRIPLSQLRYGRHKSHTFGLTVDRDIYRYAQRVSWPLFRQSKAGFVSQFGEVHG